LYSQFGFRACADTTSFLVSIIPRVYLFDCRWRLSPITYWHSTFDTGSCILVW
jgi:hypothetical protein